MVESIKYFFEYFVPTVSGRPSPKQASKLFGSELQAVGEAQMRMRQGKIISATVFAMQGYNVKFVGRVGQDGRYAKGY